MRANTIRKGDTLDAYPIFGGPALRCEALHDWDERGQRLGVVIRDEWNGRYRDKVSAVGAGQIVGTDEYRERMEG